MDWYIAPLITVEDDPVNGPGDVRVVPGRNSGGGVMVEYDVRGSRKHAHRTVEADMLIGLPSGWVAPNGWTSKTLAQAQAHFSNVKGRSATALEVF